MLRQINFYVPVIIVGILREAKTELDKTKERLEKLIMSSISTILMAKELQKPYLVS